MKTITSILALTLGLSALNVMGQADGNPPRRSERPRAERERPAIQRDGERTEALRPADERPGRLEREEPSARRPEARDQERGERPRRLARQARGIGDAAPAARLRDQARPEPGTCPYCRRNLEPERPYGQMQRGGPGYGRQAVGPQFRGRQGNDGPPGQGLGPRFGGRGYGMQRQGPGPQSDFAPGQGRGFGPRGGGSGGPLWR